MKAELLYEGKAKQVFTVKDKEQLLVFVYKHDATAFNGEKKAVFQGKGRYNNRISAAIFTYLQTQGIASHFKQLLNDTEQLVERTTIIPFEVVIRNKAAGSITRRLGIPEKTSFSTPLVELYYKDDQLGDPLINDEHAQLLTDITTTDLNQIKQMALAVNQQLMPFFYQIGLDLIDFKLEFGRNHQGTILLSDEISPDTCRLWDLATGKKMDKDVFREDLGDLIAVYDTILKRLEAVK